MGNLLGRAALVRVSVLEKEKKYEESGGAAAPLIRTCPDAPAADKAECLGGESAVAGRTSGYTAGWGYAMGGPLVHRCHVRLVINLKHLDGGKKKPTASEAGARRAEAIEAAKRQLDPTSAAYREVLNSAGEKLPLPKCRDKLESIMTGRIGKKGSRLLFETSQPAAAADGDEEAGGEGGDDGGEDGGGEGDGGKDGGGGGGKKLPVSVLVEQLVAQRYEKDGWESSHDEGRDLRTLWTLLCFDIIFAKVPDAFFTPAQTAPVDLLFQVFYQRRQAALDERFAALAAAGAPPARRDGARRVGVAPQEGGSLRAVQPGAAEAGREEG